MNYIKLFIEFIKTNKWILYIAVIVGLILLGTYFGAKLWRAEMKRMENNYLAAIEELRSDNKESQRVYELSVAEIKREFPQLKQQLKDMDIKLKNVETVQNVNTTTTNHVNTVLRDSVINDTITAKVASYKDQWIDFKLTMIDDNIHSSIVTKDSLFIVLNKVRRNFWEWLRAEPREVKSTVKNYNPNSVVTYNRLIRIDK